MNGRTRADNQCDRRAFTLMETVVAIGLVATAVGALLTGITLMLRRSGSTQANLRATQVMVEKLEALRLYTWEQIGSPFDPDDPEDWVDPFDSEDPHTTADEAEPFVLPGAFTEPLTSGGTNSNQLIFHGTMTLTNAAVSEDYGGHLLLATVTLTWTNDGRAQTSQMQTFFAKYGMQNNIRR